MCVFQSIVVVSRQLGRPTLVIFISLGGARCLGAEVARALL